ncbi:transposase [Streptomyces sp. HC307]|uniref:transposase n=1 Tax=Streptomyces flavusporus TaxID=3385496 RepID=UPI003916F454
MALSHSDLMRLLQALRIAGGVETFRVLCERVLQELIEAYVHGVSTRSVDDLVKATRGGQQDLHIGSVADLREPDAELDAFKERPLDPGLRRFRVVAGLIT